MKSARAAVSFESSDDRHFALPADGTNSLLYVFGADRKLGARAYSPTGTAFAPGAAQDDVRLDFWAADEWTDVVQPGAAFVIWYGGDVGHGTITEVIDA